MNEIKTYILENVFRYIPVNAITKRVSKVGDIIEISPEITKQRYCINKYLNFDKYNEFVSSFYKKISENFGDDSLDIFYANLATLKMKGKKSNLLSEILENILGYPTDTSYYLTTKNRIQV